MLATGLRALQIGLGVLCLYLVYTAILPLLSASPIRPISTRELSRAAPTDDSPQRYASIASRNLFKTGQVPVAIGSADSSELAEEHPESKLRVLLVGTLASSNPKFSIAVVQDQASRESSTLRVGDDIKGAEIERIEPRRIVVRNRGKLEQVTLEEEGQQASASRSRNRARSARAARPNRVRQRQPAPAKREERPDPIEGLEEFIDPMGTLGFKLDRSKGERVKSVNGIPYLDSNGDISGEAFQTIVEPGEKRFVIVDAQGNEREVQGGSNP